MSIMVHSSLKISLHDDHQCDFLCKSQKSNEDVSIHDSKANYVQDVESKSN